MIASDAPCPARAREAKRTREETDAIVAEIARLMVTGKWKRGKSAKELAERLGVSLSTAQQWTMQASRMVWSGDKDAIDELRADYLGKLDRIAEEGMTATRGKREWRKVAISAISTGADIAGAKRQVVDVTHSLAGVPEPVREAYDLAEAGDVRAIATVRAHAELEVQTIDDAQRERAGRLVEDWAWTGDEARAEVRRLLAGLAASEGGQCDG